jgi:hypothetical protein
MIRRPERYCSGQGAEPFPVIRHPPRPGHTKDPRLDTVSGLISRPGVESSEPSGDLSTPFGSLAPSLHGSCTRHTISCGLCSFSSKALYF